jgi:hypothetical protein
VARWQRFVKYPLGPATDHYVKKRYLKGQTSCSQDTFQASTNLFPVQDNTFCPFFTMKSFYALFAVAQLAVAYNVAPPGPAAPLTRTTCSSWVLVTTGMTCASIEANSGLTAAQFLVVVCLISLLEVERNLI